MPCVVGALLATWYVSVYEQPSASPTGLLHKPKKKKGNAPRLQTNLSEERNEVFRAPPGVPVHRLPRIVVGSARARVLHDCSRRQRQFASIHDVSRHRHHHPSLFPDPKRSEDGERGGEKETQRTVDTASTAKTLPSLDYRRASPERRAGAALVPAYGLRARHNVR